VNERYGPPDVIAVREVPTPMPRAGEVLVRVHASTVSSTDCGQLRAHPFFMRLVTGVTRPKRTILGTNFAGEVEAVGDGVTAFAPGDRVFGLAPGGYGGHAQCPCLPQDEAVALMPEGLHFHEAVVCEGAWHANSNLRVLDAVGKLSYFQCRRLLTPRGIFATTDLGPHNQNAVLALWGRISGRRRVVLGLPMPGRELVVFMGDRLQAGEFRAVIDRRYPLEEIVEAYRYVETGQKTGIVVIDVPRTPHPSRDGTALPMGSA